MEASDAATKTRRLIDSIRPLPAHEAKPVLIMLSGLPGTGKTFLCRQLTQRLPYIVLESDAIRKKLFPRPAYSTAENTSVFHAIDQLIQELLQKGVSIIFDATNLKENHREGIRRISESAKARLIIVNVTAPPEVVYKRMKSRVEKPGADNKSDAGWAVYERMKRDLEKISRPHITVDTSKDITPIIEKIVKEANC